MLAQKFGQVVSWWLDFDQHYETGRRAREKFDGFLCRAFGGGDNDAAYASRRRQQIIHDHASRAVEWNWDQPDRIYDFVRMEAPKSGYGYGVTAEEVFQYSQQHFGELLPKRTEPKAQEKLEELRRARRDEQPTAEPR